jgi:predicted O-methyltransferase YrrM
MPEAAKTVQLAAQFAAIGIDRCYEGIDWQSITPDSQGWAYDHPCFNELIDELRPSLVIEVGSWKGASLLEMARAAQARDLPTQFICIDTWLGSNPELWLQEPLRTQLKLENGYPQMFSTFLRNLKDAELLERVFPMPMTSVTAAVILRRWRVQADLIYIDAGHSELEVTHDLEAFHQLLRPGGVLLGDDFLPQWPGVVKAATAFSRRHNLPLEQRDEKFLIRTPSQAT